MDPRNGGRTSQVRPRPSSNGKPRRVKRRPVQPSPTRLVGYRRLERRRGLPFVAKGLLAISIIAMGGYVLWMASGGVGPVLASIVRGFGGFVETVGIAVSSPDPTEAPTVSGAPVISPPEQPYTNAESVDVTVTVPKSIAGQSGYTVQLWATVPDTEPAIVASVPIGATSVLRIPGVALAKGRNDIQASIVGPGGESERSVVVTWVLDVVKPKVQVLSPKDGAAISKATTTIKGKTQGGSTVRLNDDVNGATASVKADADGLWEASIAVGEGLNTITITITDPAGNVNTGTLSLRRGSGQLKASLSGSAYRFKVKALPKQVSFTVVVTGPGGGRLSGATALFTVSVPGLEAIVSGEVRTAPARRRSRPRSRPAPCRAAGWRRSSSRQPAPRPPRTARCSRSNRRSVVRRSASTRGSDAATIRVCRSGVVPTAGPRRSRAPGAGSAAGRPRPAPPVASSAAGSRAASGCAGSIHGGPRCWAPRCARAGRRPTPRARWGTVNRTPCRSLACP
jgi:hypothetical protein